MRLMSARRDDNIGREPGTLVEPNPAQALCVRNRNHNSFALVQNDVSVDLSSSMSPVPTSCVSVVSRRPAADISAALAVPSLTRTTSCMAGNGFAVAWTVERIGSLVLCRLTFQPSV
jgi:hypothetical protein